MKEKGAISVYLMAALSVLCALSLLHAAFGMDELGDVERSVHAELAENEEVNVRIITEQEGIELAHELPRENIRYADESQVFARIDSETLAELAEHPEVMQVELERVRYISLADSVPLINGTQTYPLQLNGINLTGAGESICIIDTGVNYSHTSLGGCFGNNNASSACKVIGGYDFVNSDSNPLDDNGHGTHVAGIAAANGSVNGAAPGARIIAIKACNAAGSCSDSAIIAGINWCIGNATLYNISVISMSLGAGLNASYCNDDPLAPSINTAVRANISVAIATGNGLDNDGTGRTTEISAPACVQNATSVAAVTKSDAIASYSNRNSLVLLMAPGSSITSTSYTGSTEANSGTSMATPHVAGALAIMRQFLRLEGVNQSTLQLERALNQSGKAITDSTGTVYSRIRMYHAIEILSNLTSILHTPVTGLFTANNQTFTCNASSLNALVNLSFFIWNASALVNSSALNISGDANGSIFAYNFTHEGSYVWNCQATNTLGFATLASANYSVTYDVTAPNVSVLSPNNGSVQNAARVNSTLNENGTCMYSLTAGVMNYSMNASDNRTFSATNTTLIQDTIYTASYYCNDTAGNRNATETRIFTVDLTRPNVTLNSPADGYSETASSSTITFSYNVSDGLNISSCSLLFGSSVNLTNSSIVNQSASHAFIQTLSAGSYVWNITCTDTAGNIGNSTSRSITLAEPSSSSVSSSSSGGGGGGTSSTSDTFTPSTSEVNSGYTKTLKKQDAIQFILFDGSSEKHTLVLREIGQDHVNITIMSDPIRLTLGIGQSVKLNLTSSSFYDLLVKLDSIAAGKAQLTVQSIRDPILVEHIQIPGNESREEENDEPEQEDVKKRGWYFYLLGVLVLMIVVAGIVHLLDLHEKKEWKKEVLQDVKRLKKKRR
ncbi:S8 family serine peptidase [Candidatus Pacearchaeota archaeon]|nr:S8 family serine peptidase [Candidatus Pacearchaeota archaeon]